MTQSRTQEGKTQERKNYSELSSESFWHLNCYDVGDLLSMLGQGSAVKPLGSTSLPNSEFSDPIAEETWGVSPQLCAVCTVQTLGFIIN